MSRYLSDKIKIISFFSMILVVFLHSYNIIVNFKVKTLYVEDGASVFIQNFITNGIARIAVPMFFLISGFLFFFKQEFSVQGILTKYRKRFKTLVIPYLFWSLFGLLLFFTLQNLPYSENFFNNEPVKEFSLAKLLDTIFLNPIPYQFWFIKSLIVLVLFSPVIYFLTLYLHIWWIVLLTILWFNNFPYPMVLGFEFSIGILFFSIGAYLSLNKNNYLERDFTKLSGITLALWFLLILIQTIIIDEIEPATFVFLQRAGSVIGVFSIWYFYDVLFRNKSLTDTKYSQLFSLSFFVFAFHEPLLTIFKKGLFFLLGITNITSIITYFAAPIITIAICIVVGSLLRNNATSFYKLITGGR